MITGSGSTGGARIYRRVDSLVKAGVPAFLLAAPLRAYILTHSKMGKILNTPVKKVKQELGTN